MPEHVRPMMPPLAQDASSVASVLERVVDKLDHLTREQAEQRRAHATAIRNLTERSLDHRENASPETGAQSLAVTHALAKVTTALVALDTRLARLERPSTTVSAEDVGAAVRSALKDWRGETLDHPAQLASLKQDLADIKAMLAEGGGAVRQPRDESAISALQIEIEALRAVIEGGSARPQLETPAIREAVREVVRETVLDAVLTLPQSADHGSQVAGIEAAPAAAFVTVGLEASLDRFERLLDREEASVDAMSDLGESLTRVALEATGAEVDRLETVESRLQELISALAAQADHTPQANAVPVSAVELARIAEPDEASSVQTSPVQIPSKRPEGLEWVQFEDEDVFNGALAPLTADSLNLTDPERVSVAAEAGDAVGWRSPWTKYSSPRWWEDEALDGAFGRSPSDG